MSETPSTRVKTTPKPPDTDTGVILLTKEELAELIASTIKATTANSPALAGVSETHRQELSTQLQTTLSSKINNRLRSGNAFFSAMANSKARVNITIDSIYREFIGNFLPVTLNGSMIKIPVDGKPHLVHPAHAALAREKLFAISETRARNTRTAEPGMFGTEVGDFEQVNK